VSEAGAPLVIHGADTCPVCRGTDRFICTCGDNTPAKERAAIVALIRRYAKRKDYRPCSMALEVIAVAIERGDR